MKKQNYFNTKQLASYIYSNGVLFNKNSYLTYFFKFNKDIFNSERWLKKRKTFIFDNKKLLKFKKKFSN